MIDWIKILSPIAGSIIERIIKGERVKNSEHSFILLYSIAQDIKELRNEFSRFNDATHQLQETINQLRVEIAELRGKI